MNLCVRKRIMQKSSFNITSLVVIVILLGLLAFAMLPAINNEIMLANRVDVSARGKDIYMSITRANAERELIGLPSLWPTYPETYANAATDCVASVVTFTNSTDYFMFLNDHENIGTANHNPLIGDFDYGKLSGAGVKPYSGTGPLKPENNMWTVIGNYRDDMPDILPVIFTRNVAAESMAASIPVGDCRRMYFDTAWRTPFADASAVFIRKNGGVFAVREKFMVWWVVYNHQCFDVNSDANGQPVESPLKYLTPDHQVFPSDETYNAGMDKYVLKFFDSLFYSSRVSCFLLASVSFLVFFIGLLYLVVFSLIALFNCMSTETNWRLKVGTGYWFCHWLTVSLYVTLVLCILAVIVQVAGYKYLDGRVAENEIDDRTYFKAKNSLNRTPLYIPIPILIYILLNSYV